MFFAMYCYALVVLSFLHIVACQETLFGVVSLSLSPFTSVSVNQDGGYVNVSLLLYDSATNTPSINSSVFIDEDVVVRCSVITPYENGDSRVMFTESVIPSFAESGSIDFSIVDQGRTVEVQCSGETSPDNTGTTSYFSFDTSAGPTGFLVVKKSPVVSFCESIILVPISSGITSSTVQVELSEPVIDYRVTVSCNIIGVIDANGSSIDSANNSLVLDFQDATVEPGSRTDIIIRYNIQRRGDIVQVACSAASEEGTQYLQDTSQGEAAIFQQETSSVTLVPSVSSIDDPRITVFLVLGAVLTPGEGIITYACYVDPVMSYEQGLELAANPTCETPDDVFQRPTPAPVVTTVTAAMTATTDNSTANVTTPTTPAVQTTPSTAAPTTPTPAPATSTPAPTRRTNETTTPWRLEKSEVAFQEGDIFKELTLNLESSTPTFNGAILVSCCAPQDINSNAKYINTSTAMVFFANVQEPRAVNFTTGTDQADRFSETAFPNPAYVDLSPCPCDLTSGHCDGDCCCDQDCNEADILVFTCYEEIEEYPVTIYDCNSTDLYREDWSPLLCVQTSNSPYLGLYHSTVTAIRDIATFNAAKASSLNSRDTSYQDSGLRSLEYQSVDNSKYNNGDPVELLYNEEVRGFLALPQMTLDGECLWTSPVKFQEDLTTRCTLMPDQRLCQQFSPFSALMFLRSSTESYPPCPKEPKVAGRFGQATEAPADIEYYCLEDISDYLSEQSVDQNLFDLYESSLFAEHQNDTSEAKIPKRCLWDDGYTQPPVPSYNNDTKLCSNSVVSASYEMFWRGGEIVRIEGQVILGTVPLIQDLSIGIEEEEEFVSPPPSTIQPTEEPLLTSIMGTEELNSVTIITDVTEVFETAITELTDGTDNMTIFMLEEEDNVTTAQPSTITTPPAMTLQVTTSSTTQPALTPPTTPSVTTPQSVTTPGAVTTPVISVTPSNVTDNTTMGVDNVNVTTDMTTEVPGTTPLPPDPVNTMPLNITLRFSTTFTYLPETLVDPLTGQNVEPPEAFERSGNPGYIIGKPLLTGVMLQTPLVLPTDPGPPVNCTEFPTNPSCIEVPENETVYVFDSVDTSPSNQLQVFTPGDGSLCALSSTSTLTFGEDLVSGCILRMGQSELQNCSILAAYMEEQLRALVPADRIGKRGNSSVLVEDDWAEIFNPDDHPFDPPTTVPPTTEAPLETTPDPLTTRFPGQRYVDPEPPIDALEQLTSRCSGIPTSMNLEVLIAEAGVYSGVPQYEVLAARVQYSTSTVTLTCSGSLGASCILEGRPVVSDPAGNGTIVQSFPVYSTVTYTTVPALEPEPVILYYKDYDPDLCKQDGCLAELFYPLTEGFDGDTYQYSIAVSLVLVIITTAYFIVTSPWAHL
ncbi:mucin-17-like isoform X1 [Lytechinus variegatus]|uniref:mucin-17-like isoform X1 n=1 Tax=Lytechinus variegatus TaxID=7654 RepID=UPI001BB25978|nr:mucin-17-like isoform X1 [Lytechinus variegatus]